MFDDAQVWRLEPRVAVAGLLASDRFRFTNRSTMALSVNHRLREGSAQVYMLMFDKYLRHLVEAGSNLVDTGVEDTSAFFGGTLQRVSSETRVRYARLLERIFEHMCSLGVRTENPVSLWVRSNRGVNAGASQQPDTAGSVSAAQVARLQDWLYTYSREPLTQGDWRLCRDLTLASLSLGTGMRCTELMRLSRRQVKYWPGGPVPERFEFEIPGWASVVTARAHRAPAGRDCVALMELWWSARWSGPADPASSAGRKAMPAGDHVFPATLSGKPLTASTLYRNLKDVSAAALKAGALTESTRWVLERGAQGLRRAFVLTSLESGVPAELLTERLGHWHRRSVRRYRQGGAAGAQAPLLETL